MGVLDGGYDTCPKSFNTGAGMIVKACVGGAAIGMGTNGLIVVGTEYSFGVLKMIGVGVILSSGRAACDDVICETIFDTWSCDTK